MLDWINECIIYLLLLKLQQYGLIKMMVVLLMHRMFKFILSDKIQRVNCYFGFYDPLQYPLLLPHGQGGWHCGIKKFYNGKNVSTNPTLSELEQLPNIKFFAFVDGYLDMEDETLQKEKRKRDAVSVREYYCYKLQMRNDDEDDILHTGRLLQQYSIDEYIKSETQRLDFVLYNPDLFRMSIYQGLLDILRLGERNSSNVGKQTFLPNSFIGGPRDMRQRYMDAIALVQHFGKPDLFITITCNPSWPEIKEHLSSLAILFSLIYREYINLE